MRTPVQIAGSLALAVVRRWRALRLPETAASLAYLSLFAVVPVFTIAISLLGALPVFAPMRAALISFLSANFFLPTFSATLLQYLNQFAAKSNELSVIGAAIFFASAFASLVTIENTLNRIWHVDRPRSFARRVTLYWTFLTLGPLLIAGSVVVNGVVAAEFFGGARLRAVEHLWLDVLPWAITIVGLTLVYRLLPNAAVRWRDALVGAIVVAVLLHLLKLGLGMQIARLPTYTVVYGTFALLPVFLLWLFMVWLAVLGGAVLAASLPGVLAGQAERPPETPATRFDVAMRVLAELARADAAGEPVARASSLRRIFDADEDLAARTVSALAELGYVDRFWRAGEDPGDERAPWDEYWRISPCAPSMTLRPLFERVWGTARGDGGMPFDPREIDRPLKTREAAPGSS